MYVYGHLVAPPPIPDSLTVDEIIRQFLRGELAPEAELHGPAGTTNVWGEILRSNAKTSNGWLVNRCEQVAATASWSIIEPGEQLRWISGPYTLDQLRRMNEAGAANEATEARLQAAGAKSIPLGWLLALPMPVLLPECKPQPRGDSTVLLVGKVLLGTAAAAVTVIGTFKLAQAATDEDFGTTEYPAWFRRKLIEQHVSRHGWYCPACDSNVPRGSLTVDHIVAIRNGGRTSRANAQVLCRWCNSKKGARNKPWDYVKGRVA